MVEDAAGAADRDREAGGGKRGSLADAQERRRLRLRLQELERGGAWDRPTSTRDRADHIPNLSQAGCRVS